jgi:hypothetical protein
MIIHITYSMVVVGLAYKQGKSADTWHRQLTFDARGGWQGGSVFGFPAAPIHEQNVLDLQIFSHHTTPRQSMFRISIACDNQMLTAGGRGSVWWGRSALTCVDEVHRPQEVHGLDQLSAHHNRQAATAAKYNQ